MLLCSIPTESPHYDLHYYLVTPAYRVQTMTCDLVPKTPVCDVHAQSTAQGQAFFELETTEGELATGSPFEILKNMPLGFNYSTSDAVINMGMHAFNYARAPAKPEDWVDPTFVLCTYGRQIVAVEAMIPGHFSDGDQDHAYDEALAYVDQTIDELPYYFSVDYDAASHETTIVLKGKSRVCQADFDVAKTKYEASQNDGTTLCQYNGEDCPPTVSAAPAWFFKAAVMTMLLGILLIQL